MFIVLEVQANIDETAGTLVTTYSTSDKNMAESKFHNVLASAAVSNVYRHSAFLLTDMGKFLRSECYEHDVPIPELEPETTEN